MLDYRPMARLSRALVVAIGAFTPVLATSAISAQSGGASYWVYVANESSDIVSRVRFDDSGIVEERAIDVGFHPADLDGAHGIAVSPTSDHWYVSIAHGQPYGQVWKMGAQLVRVRRFGQTRRGGFREGRNKCPEVLLCHPGIQPALSVRGSHLPSSLWLEEKKSMLRKR